MPSSSFLENLTAEREARTRRERHGVGVLIRVDGRPVGATGCVLPDSTLVDARCLTVGSTVEREADHVWTRPGATGSPLRRRGRLVVEPGVALRFVDDPMADVGITVEAPPALDRDLSLSPRVRALVRSDLLTKLIYAALCNTVWRHRATGQEWRCSWRSAGGVVAHLRGEGDYLDWYCAGGEGSVDEQVLAELQALGWELAEADSAFEAIPVKTE